MLLKANHEPSNHVLRDLAEASAQLDGARRPIVVLPEDEGFGIGDRLAALLRGLL